ncbi:peroxide stress protein YaaA [Paracrocinitomix mangrovi]|uniref:peroxide stress protein YaaA n=1 Tax=Paracrocinitomix mangrovi TaxID=2862509 RepID=UPI001C8EBA9E|nr:peroxide stress protein YaaA [Paracrocinitomix mangrovi]UKN01643.1 peroxide stress protein YaaA [Paracrocinitomix mangrovi]
MKVILSPAKSMNEEVSCEGIETSQPIFPDETEKLANKLGKLSAKQIKKLMGVSDNIAELNYDRYQAWNKSKEVAKPAGMLFTGAAYQALKFDELDKKEQVVGQDKLRILSGLYGVLKPLDLIKPYRLEMGTSFKLSASVTNLYKFWGDKIRKSLDEELKEDDSPILVNAASSEYFKAAQLNKLQNGKVITTTFKDEAKDGTYKSNMTYAKHARGAMARYIIQNDIKSEDGLKAFNLLNYRFDEANSTDTEFIYLRDINQRVLP